MSEPRKSFHPLAVGAAFGLANGDLLLGLNPDRLGLPAVRLLLSCAAAGALLAAPFLLFRARERPARAGWLALFALAAAFGAFTEEQREMYYFFLRNGARRVLVATALAATLAALAYAAAALRRPAAAGALRLHASVLVIFALPAVFGRRDPEPAGLSTPPALPRTATRSLLVVGFEGLSWDLVSAFASDGSLPVFAKLLEGGAAGPLEPVRPYDRAALWTSAATGKWPSKHGVVADHFHATPLGGLALLPRLPGDSGWHADRTATSRRGQRERPARSSRAFWEILASRGHEASLLSWPYSDPAGDGLVLWATERLFDDGLDARTARPREAAERALLFRVPPANLDRPLAESLVPTGLGARTPGGPLDQAAHDLTVVGWALGAIPTGPKNVAALVLSGAAAVARPFGPAAEPARYFGLAIHQAELKARALKAYYRFLDETLGDLLSRQGQDRVLCVFSPVSHGPPPPLSAVAAVAAGRQPEASPEAGHDGFVILFGSGIRAGVRLTSARVLDLAPTLLVLAGEPIARDVDGRVLAEAFDERFAGSATIPVITTFEPNGPQ